MSVISVMDDDVEEPPEAADELSEAAIEVEVVEAVADVAGVIVDPDTELVCAKRLLKLCDSSKQIFFHR